MHAFFIGCPFLWQEAIIIGLGIFRLGFITDEDLSEFHIMDKVGVYIPMSYTFTGQLYFVNKDQITELPHSMSADTIKYILSGGVMEMDEVEGKKGNR